MSNGITVINIREYLSSDAYSKLGEVELSKLLSEYSCIKNPDVERFFKSNSVEFTKKNQSVTYLVFLDNDVSFVGYFSITIKPICVSAEKFSNTTKRKIARVSDLNVRNNTYSLSAYLIAQLGKNFSNESHTKISGDQLLHVAIDTIKELQYMAGGMVCFLETENEPKLLDFYEKRNGFKRFSIKESRMRNGHKLIQLLKIL